MLDGIRVTSNEKSSTLGLWEKSPRGLNKIHHPCLGYVSSSHSVVPFGVTYEKIGTIQRRLAWPLHKDDTLSRSGRSTDLNIYFLPIFTNNIGATQHKAPISAKVRDKYNAEVPMVKCRFTG